MNLTDNSVQSRQHVVDGEGDEMAALPIDLDTLLDAVGQALGMSAGEEREQREREVGALRDRVVSLEGKVASLEGKIDVVLTLLSKGGEVIDLPSPLPRKSPRVA